MDDFSKISSRVLSGLYDELKKADSETTKDALKDFDTKEREHNLSNKKQNMELRRFYSKWTFIGVGVWVGFVMLSTTLQGFHFYYHLQQAEMIALLTTNTASIVGILAIIFNYLFKDSS